VPQLVRVIAFMNTDNQGTTGLGDLTLNQFFILSKKKWGQFGLGYDVQVPIGAPAELRSNQWTQVQQ